MTTTAFTRTLIVAVAAASFGALAAPASASDEAANSGNTQRSPAAQQRDDANRRYCVNISPSGGESVTGSMLSRRTCRTRAQWAREGVQIPAGN